MDVLRENIGLLQLDNEYYYDEEPINEFSLFSKKKTRLERFKDAISRNKGRIAAGALGLGAAWTGHSRYGYNKMKDEGQKQLKAKGYVYNKDKDEWIGKTNNGNYEVIKFHSWNPLKQYNIPTKNGKVISIV